MYNLKFILQLLDKKTLLKLSPVLGFFALIPIFDIILVFYLGNLIGNYLTMAILCFLSFTGYFIAVYIMSKILEEIDAKQNRGLFPQEDFNGFVGGLIASFLIILPGPAGTIIGFLILIPFLRNQLGRMISGKVGIDWHEIYEYLKIMKNS